MASRETKDNKPANGKQAAKPKSAFPPMRAKIYLQRKLSDPVLMKRIKDLLAEFQAKIPAEARESLRPQDGSKSSPTERRMTKEVLAKFVPKKTVAEWERLGEELAAARKEPGHMRGNKKCGFIVSNFLEYIVAEMIKTGVRRLHSLERSKMKPEHIVIGTEDDESYDKWYPFVANLPTFDKIKEEYNEQEQDGDGDDEEADEASEANGADEEDHDGDSVDGEDGEDGEDLTASIPSPQCNNSVMKINHEITAKTGYKTSMTREVRDFFKQIVIEILDQIADTVKILLDYKHQCTLDEEVIQTTIRLFMSQVSMKEEGEELLKRVSTEYGKVKEVYEKTKDNGEVVTKTRHVPLDGDNLGANYDDLVPLEIPESKRKARKDVALPAEMPKPSGGRKATLPEVKTEEPAGGADATSSDEEPAPKKSRSKAAKVPKAEKAEKPEKAAKNGKAKQKADAPAHSNGKSHSKRKLVN